VNTDAGAVESAGVDAHELGGALPVVGAMPGLVKGTASIELASGAEKAAAAKPEALGPGEYSKAGRGCVGRITAARQGQTSERKPEALASTSGQNEEILRTRAQLAAARCVARGHPVHLRGSTER